MNFLSFFHISKWTENCKYFTAFLKTVCHFSVKVKKVFLCSGVFSMGALGAQAPRDFWSLAKESTELQTIMGGGHYSGHTQIKLLNITLLLDLKKYWKNGLWKYKGALFISKLYLKIPPPTLFSSNTAPLRARKTVLEEDPLYLFVCILAQVQIIVWFQDGLYIFRHSFSTKSMHKSFLLSFKIFFRIYCI